MHTQLGQPLVAWLAAQLAAVQALQAAGAAQRTASAAPQLLRHHTHALPGLLLPPLLRFELLICLDSSIQAEVLKQLSAERPAHPGSYTPRICCLTDFLMYCPDDVLLRTGTTALLDRQLRGAVQLALPALRPSAARIAAAAAAAAETSSGGGGAATSSGEALPAVAVPAYMLPTGIPRPPLTAGSYDADGGECDDPEGCSPDELWERMALLTAVCCAGLVQYLLDLYPLSDDTGMDD